MKTLGIAFKIFLILTLLALLGFLGVALCLSLGKPLWLSPAVMGGLLLLIVLFILGRRLYYKRREGAFLKKVLTPGEESLAVQHGERPGLEALRRAFAAGADALRLAPAGGAQNLPWFMLLGRSGAGKSLMLDRAGLEGAAVGHEPGRPPLGTDYCAWRLDRRAVFLDVAGRYCGFENPVEDAEEWSELLSLLKKRHAPKPLDGVILVLPADLLARGLAREISEYAKECRLRLNQIAAMQDEAPAIHVMVTKCDLLRGAFDLYRLLTPPEREEALGVMNAEGEPTLSFSAGALDQVIAEIKRRRLSLAGRDARRAAALALPLELAALKPAFQLFFQELAENPYQYDLNLRGLFFSSARFEGREISALLGESELDEQLVAPEHCDSAEALANRALFLTAFFTEILPREPRAGRLRPDVAASRAKKSLARLGVFLLALLAVVWLSAVSYRDVRQAEENLYLAMPESQGLNGDFIHDVLALTQMRDQLSAMEAALNKGVLNGLWTSQGRDTLSRLEDRYCELFRRAVYVPVAMQMDAAYNEALSGQDPGGDAFLGYYINHIIWRLNAMDHKEHEERWHNQADDMRVIMMLLGPDKPDMSARLVNIYDAYYAWRNNPAQAERESALLRGRMASIVQSKGQAWLSEWIISNDVQPALRLSDFWQMPGGLKNDVAVPSSFTAEGRRQINHTWEHIAGIMPASYLVNVNLNDFWRRYRDRYYQAWLDLARRFPAGLEGLDTRSEWISRASEMAGFQNPYIEFLLKMRDELAALNDLGPKPGWAELADQLAYIVTEKINEGRPEPLSSQVMNFVRDAAEKTVAKVDVEVFSDLSAKLQATEIFGRYNAHLQELLPGVTSPDAGYALARRHYSREGDQPPPGDLALADIYKLHALIGNGDNESSRAVWALLEGPLEFLAATVNQQAAAQLEDYWGDKVLSQTVFVSPQSLWETLFNEQNGLIQAFLENYAAGFVYRDVSGWRSDSWMGLTLPFTDGFFTLINAGWRHGQAAKDVYSVGLTARPPEVAPPDAPRPYLVSLYMECAEGERLLENYNFPAEGVFDWKPGQCGDVVLEIVFDNFTAEKIWPGPNGFVDFLKTFRTGQATFGPDDFPETADLMKSAGVSSITVRYDLSGAENVRADAAALPALKVPERITSPWTGVSMPEIDAGMLNRAASGGAVGRPAAVPAPPAVPGGRKGGVQ